MEVVARKTRKQHIYESASKLFRDKGYMATSMRDLADDVGLEPSSLYSHIKSKEELLHKICFECGNRFIGGIKEITSTDLKPDEAIRALVQLHVNIAAEDITAITVFNDEWRHLTEPDLTHFMQMRKNYEDACLAIITRGVTEGMFTVKDERLTLNTLLSALQWVYRKKRIHQDEADQISDQVSDLFIHGLKHQA